MQTAAPADPCIQSSCNHAFQCSFMHPVTHSCILSARSCMFHPFTHACIHSLYNVFIHSFLQHIFCPGVWSVKHPETRQHYTLQNFGPAQRKKASESHTGPGCSRQMVALLLDPTALLLMLLQQSINGKAHMGWQRYLNWDVSLSGVKAVHM